MKRRKEKETRRKTLPKSAKCTDDDSTDDSAFLGTYLFQLPFTYVFYIFVNKLYVERLKRKLPISKRRRIPASTRPMNVSSTFSPSIWERMKRPKLINKDGLE